MTYSVLKVPLNPNQPTNCVTCNFRYIAVTFFTAMSTIVSGDMQISVVIVIDCDMAKTH